MAKHIFEVERTYTWRVEIDLPDDKTRKEAEELMWNDEKFNENCAQKSHLEIVDYEKEESDAD